MTARNLTPALSKYLQKTAAALTVTRKQIPFVENTPFQSFFTFYVDQLGEIRRHQ